MAVLICKTDLTGSLRDSPHVAFASSGHLVAAAQAGGMGALLAWLNGSVECFFFAPFLTCNILRCFSACIHLGSHWHSELFRAKKQSELSPLWTSLETHQKPRARIRLRGLAASASIADPEAEGSQNITNITRYYKTSPWNRQNSLRMRNLYFESRNLRFDSRYNVMQAPAIMAFKHHFETS